MVTITNKSGREVFVPELGLLEPGENEIDQARVERFEATGKSLNSLAGGLEVKRTRKKEKEEDS